MLGLSWPTWDVWDLQKSSLSSLKPTRAMKTCLWTTFGGRLGEALGGILAHLQRLRAVLMDLKPPLEYLKSVVLKTFEEISNFRTLEIEFSSNLNVLKP